MAYLLIVDDDEDFAAAAAKALSNAGHEVRVELDIAGAMQSLDRKRPDLIILDVMFPENASAGFDMARLIKRERETLKDVPILMLTAINVKFPLGFGVGDVDQDWLPVNDFVEKPVDLAVLRNRVATLLETAVR
jgi:DNA-binding response OmpR family regulator